MKDSDSVFHRGAIIGVITLVILAYVVMVLLYLSGCQHTAPSPGPYDPCHLKCVNISNRCQVEHDVHYCNREFEMCMNDCSE